MLTDPFSFGYIIGLIIAGLPWLLFNILMLLVCLLIIKKLIE